MKTMGLVKLEKLPAMTRPAAGWFLIYIFFLFNTKAQYSALKLLLVFNSTPGQVKLFLNYDKDMERPSTATLRNK
jgi:hypothetical protein